MSIKALKRNKRRKTSDPNSRKQIEKLVGASKENITCGQGHTAVRSMRRKQKEKQKLTPVSVTNLAASPPHHCTSRPTLSQRFRARFFLIFFFVFPVNNFCTRISRSDTAQFAGERGRGAKAACRIRKDTT